MHQIYHLIAQVNLMIHPLKNKNKKLVTLVNLLILEFKVQNPNKKVIFLNKKIQKILMMDPSHHKASKKSKDVKVSQILRIYKVNHPYHYKVSKRKNNIKFSHILRVKKVKKKKEYKKMKNQIVALEHNSRHKNRKRRKKLKCSRIRIVN